MKGLLKNRTLIGILCIVIALIICFGLTPLFNNAMSARGDIVRVRTDIQRGELITSDMLEIVNAGTYNLPPNILMTRDEVTGRYALADMQRGDYVLSGKVSAIPLAEFEYLSTLDGTKQAMSVTIKSFAAGVSGKLEAGDIVTLIAADYGDRRETSLPPELQYVYVLAVTAGSGNDKEAVTQDQQRGNNDERELPTTITVLVDPTQAVLLADLEAKGRIHAALVYRGPRSESQKFLDVQDEYIASLTEDELTDIEGGGLSADLERALDQDLSVPETPELPDAVHGGDE
jgi:SAF domain.